MLTLVCPCGNRWRVLPGAKAANGDHVALCPVCAPDGHEYGMCECGCGHRPELVTRTRPHLGIVKGQPRRFCNGHSLRVKVADDPTAYELRDCGFTSPCWVWQRGLSTQGYGTVNVGGANTYAHRLFYERHVGPIPDGLHIDHLCRNRGCVNPAHLEPVTPTENFRRRPDLKLSVVDAAEIRARREAGESVRSIARDFGINEGHCSRVSRGLKWAACPLGLA